MSARGHLLAYRRMHPVKLGPVRETKQYTIDTEDDVYRWDYWWKDPASGREYGIYVIQNMPIGAPHEMLNFAAKTAKGCIQRALETKCGDAHVPVKLAMPPGVIGRYV